MSDKPIPPYVHTHSVHLACYDGNDRISAPPEEILDVCVVADRAFLELCDLDDGNPTKTVTTKTLIQVDAAALLNALVTQMGVEKVQLAIPYFTGGHR